MHRLAGPTVGGGESGNIQFYHDSVAARVCLQATDGAKGAMLPLSLTQRLPVIRCLARRPDSGRIQL